MRNADAVHELDRDLRTIFPGRVASVVAYGTTVSGPVATLAIVDRLGADELRYCAERTPGWHSRGLATPLLLQADEFERSLDAFPFEFGAILASYDVVSGPDPFAGLGVDPSDVRRACEVQARSHLLHLREGFLETAGRNDDLADLIVRSAPALAALIEHVGRMPGAPAPSAMLARVTELARGGTISSDEARMIFPEYLAGMDGLVNALDRWSAA